MTEPLVLKTSLGAHAHVAPLRDGRVGSPRVRFDFIDYDPLPKAFRRMVRDVDLDICEMAVVNQVLAVDHGVPITSLAIPLWSRLPHTNLMCARDSVVQGPKDLEGHKVGVRAYAQTSGVWVRGLLKTEYGVDLSKVGWITMEDAHVASYSDPPGVVRNTSPDGLRELMAKGEVVAIMGERVVDPGGVRTVIPDAEQTAEAWVRKSGLMPVNHVLAARVALLEAHPWLAAELSELFDAARRIAIAEDGAEPPPEYGLEPNRRSLQLLLDFCFDQKVVSRPYSVDELCVDPAKGLAGLHARRGAAA